MIAGPANRQEFNYCRQFLLDRSHARISDDAHMLVWVTEGRIKWAVAFDDWCGFTCQMHMASSQPYAPRKMIEACFNYAFNIINRKRVFGMVNSHNERALRFDLWLGFKEVLRMDECAEDGGDIIVLQMTADEWKVKHGKAISTTSA